MEGEVGEIFIKISEKQEPEMKKNLTLFLCLFVVFLFSRNFYAASYSPCKALKKNGTNLLLITIDTLRADRLSCYNPYFLKTPHIDALAARGTIFKRAFAHNSTTLPSHANILLGTTPLYHGVHDNFNFIIREEMVTLAEYLAEQGYATGAFVGAYPLDSRFGLAQGFTTYDDEYRRQHEDNFYSPERRAEKVINHAVDWIGGQTSPWFAWIHCFDPHVPYDPPEPFKSRFAKTPYDGEVAYIDQEMGRLFKYLESKNLIENTAIIFTGDHGESLGDHGEETHSFFAYNSTIWIPLIISAPELKPRSNTQTVSHIDIFPTVCEILKLKKPAFLQGKSLLPAMKGKKLKTRPVYFESLYSYYNHGWAPLVGFIRGDEKFIDSPIYELYDLKADFNEKVNLFQPAQIRTYKDYLERIIKDFSVPVNTSAKNKFDRKSLEKLQSLGYLSGYHVASNKKFTKADDIKVLLPTYYKTQDAWDTYKAGKTEDAISILRKILAEKNKIDMAYNRLARIYSETGRIQEALKILEQGLEQFPSSYKTFIDYIRTLNNAAKYSQVIKVIDDSGFVGIDLDPELWYQLGLAYLHLREHSQAIKAYEKTIFLDPNYPEVFHNLGETYFALALKSKKRADLVKASKMYRKAIELDPTYPKPFNGLGKVYHSSGDISAAIEQWKKALKVDPDHSGSLFNLGMAYFEQQKYREAYPYFTHYKKLYYHRLSLELKSNLERLIKRCIQAP
jgi:arylsulfatase A-like enzyme/Tfp pilus assembly protein PilF